MSGSTSTSVLDEMVEARLGWVSPTLTTWYAEAELRTQLRTALSAEAERLENSGFGREYRDLVAADRDPDPLAWANRRLDLDGGGWAVTGIRFRGRDVDRPFVDVVATTAPPTDDGLSMVASAAGPAYGSFDPLCLRVDAPHPLAMVGDAARDPRFGPRCAVDMFVVAGPVDRLREYPRAEAYDRVSLRTGEPESLAHRVSSVYDALVAADPELAMWAAPEDVASLRACSEEGLLFEVLVDDETAGVVAALRDDGHGMRGFAVQEICLDPGHRGRGLAPAVLQRLIDRLPTGAGGVLWGTIHPENAPSLRNALSIGRQVVGGYVWITPEGSDGMPGVAG